MARKLLVNTFVSLDGVMQAPGGPQEDPTGGFDVGGWSAPHWDEVMGSAMAEAFGRPLDLVLGRRTYEIFAAHWPFVHDETADWLNAMTKHVASRTLSAVSWQGARLLPGDAGDAITELKRQDGPDLMVQGSADLLQTLLRRELVDELSVWTFPVLLGHGKRLFGEGTQPGALRLLRCVPSTTGVVISTYAADGAVRRGDFQLSQPGEAELARREALRAESAA
ncbi:dihydrofolate reductase family protein [Motilibacter deserti]|uniref:Dihydrofolate reductase n=1 Tax=Motilibacter deserti TaxID=2714956 RepID=A0ABX0GT37_9ACTN|nr:dihydrofolate reductase family protein [Motilibacter deserti]NHC12984.1 dihydrofolate reductase [Motilibacter deserti]